MKINTRSIRAFTLIEMIVTVVVVAIIMTMAVPSFNSHIQNSRAIATANNLFFALKLARSEAIKRAVSVSVCPAGNVNFTACGSDWTQGWLVFVNSDENSVFQNNTVEPLIRSEQVTGSNYTITPLPNTSVITFNSSGFAQTGNTTFTVQAAGCVTDHARTVSISTTGRTFITAINCI